MNQYKVSVIIACYNEERHISKCISSLLNQTYKPLEIIVVDDGSTDKTPLYIKEFSKVIYMRMEHQGTAKSRNAATKRSSGQILSFLDADMEFEPDFIEKLVQPINQGKVCGTFSKLEFVKNWDNPLARCYNRNNNPPLPDKMRIPQDSDEGDDFRAILKSEFMKVGGFDNTGYTDTWSLAQKLHYKAQNAPGAIYYHYNPDTLDDVYNAAQWIGRRRYKGGKAGSLAAMIRSNAFLALIKGVRNAATFKEPSFILFQLVYEAGIFQGAFISLLTNDTKK